MRLGRSRMAGRCTRCIRWAKLRAASARSQSVRGRAEGRRIRPGALGAAAVVPAAGCLAFRDARGWGRGWRQGREEGPSWRAPLTPCAVPAAVPLPTRMQGDGTEGGGRAGRRGPLEGQHRAPVQRHEVRLQRCLDYENARGRGRGRRQGRAGSKALVPCASAVLACPKGCKGMGDSHRTIACCTTSAYPPSPAQNVKRAPGSTGVPARVHMTPCSR